MKENSEIKVILSKVGWCGHCTDFLPVFNESKNLIKNNKILKNVNVDFEVYDMEQDKGIFETKYGELVNKVEGYPTVFLAQIKNDKLSKTIEIGHAQKSVDFIKLISDAYKGFSVQTGGNLEDDMYKQKYLKYKSKYIELKAQFGGVNRFTLIIKRHPENYPYYWYYYFIIDNQKPANIYTYDPNRIFPFDPTKLYSNIVAFHHDQTPIKTTDGEYSGLAWPREINTRFKGTPDWENHLYREEFSQKFGEKIWEIKGKHERKEEPFFPTDHSKLLEISFD